MDVAGEDWGGWVELRGFGSWTGLEIGPQGVFGRRGTEYVSQCHEMVEPTAGGS